MPEVNGQQYQHATVRPVAVSTGGTFKLKTFTKTSYKVKAPKEATNDAQGDIDGFVIRKKEHEASITLKLSEWFEFRQWLLSQNPGLGVLQCQFDLPVSYGPRLGALKTDTLRTVMVNEEPRESEDGQDVLTVELPLFFLKADLADGPAMVYDQ